MEGSGLLIQSVDNEAISLSCVVGHCCLAQTIARESQQASAKTCLDQPFPVESNLSSDFSSGLFDERRESKAHSRFTIDHSSALPYAAPLLTYRDEPAKHALMSHHRFIRIVLAAFLAALSTGCSLPMMLPVALPPDQVDLTTAITFSKPDGQTLNMDMARPKTAAGPPLPAVVCIYGGGWISGSRSGMRPWIEYLAAHGYVAVAPTYRLAPKYPFPAAVADVRNCVRWLRRHAKEYNIDPKHIGAVGLSAGGHLSLMLGLAGDEDPFGPDDVSASRESAKVQAVVNYFGPADLVAKDWSSLAVNKFLVPFLGGDKTRLTESGRRASPLSYISKDDPPILTFQGDSDLTVPPRQAYELHSRLSQAGLSNELQVIVGQGHGWGDPHLSRTRQDMVRFFNRHLKGIVVMPAASSPQSRPHADQ